MKKAVFWFRRDLRLSDNAGLTQATHDTDEVICLFVLDPRLTEHPDTCEARLAFMYSCLADLDETLQAKGGRLIIRKGDIEAEILKVMQEAQAETLYFNHDYTPYARKRNEQVSNSLTQKGYVVKTAKDVVIFEKDEILTGSDKPYTVFTPYKKNWLKKIEQDLPGRYELKSESLQLQSDEAKKLKSLTIPPIPAKLKEAWYLPAGETAGRERLKYWAGIVKEGKNSRQARLEHYAEKRDFPADDGTSRLSPFLRFGAISPRQCYRAARNARKEATTREARDGCDTWVGELIWRDFYWQILWHFPHVAKGAFQEKYAKLDWQLEAEHHLKAWKEGLTGYPIVDAGMRQLNQMNWMHNRLRMITASFLVKDLLINWQEGERYFWQKLVDGDQAANNGGWQWSASTGTDAQPYFRIFSPVSQSQKFDPKGGYIRQFVPELAKVPDKYIHAPWTMPANLQEHLGIIIGKDYPTPIVDHAQARLKALALFKRDL
jgi:deoxyribodipyrimidine photo-lyase